MSSWWWQLLGGRAPTKGSVVIGWPPVSAMDQAVWKGPTTRFLRDLLTMAICHQIREPKKLILELALFFHGKTSESGDNLGWSPRHHFMVNSALGPTIVTRTGGGPLRRRFVGGETRGGCWKNQPCRYYLLPGTQMTSIFEGQAPTTRPKFQSKPGSFGFQVLKMVIF